MRVPTPPRARQFGAQRRDGESALRRAHQDRPAPVCSSGRDAREGRTRIDDKVFMIGGQVSLVSAHVAYSRAQSMELHRGFDGGNDGISAAACRC